MITVAALVLAMQAAQPAVGAVPAPVEEKKVCRRVGAATGSVLNRPRECHTVAEWAQINRFKDKLNARFNDTRNREIGMPKGQPD